MEQDASWILYTQKCLFDIDSVEMDGNVKVFRFVRERD
jgi:hypothetical protein